MKLSRIDREAMARAIAQLRRRGGEDARQIERMLQDRPWREVGAFASYSCQDKALHLKPWQTPPCWLRSAGAIRAALATPPPDLGHERAAGELVRRLLAVGLSRYEPDVPGALERAEAKAATEREPTA
jgi:hypothetical protein